MDARVTDEEWDWDLMGWVKKKTPGRIYYYIMNISQCLDSDPGQTHAY